MVLAKKVVAKTPVKKQKISALMPVPQKTKKGEKASKAKETKTPSKNNNLTIKDVSKTSAKKNIGFKLKAVEAFHTKQKQTIAPLVSNEIPKSSKKFTSLALLSPYRLPIDSKKLAVATARFGGTFFVMLGALFTLFFANGAFSTQTQVASLSTAVSTTATNTINQLQTLSTIDCTSILQYESAYCSNMVNKKPDATFTIQQESGRHSKSVKVRVEVPFAKGVKLGAYNKTAQKEVVFGRMTKLTDIGWELYVDTSVLDDGEYKFKVLIENGYGAYEDLHLEYITVENNPLVLPTGGGTTTSATLPVVKTAPDTLPEPLFEVEPTEALLSVDKSQSSNEFRFEIKAENAKSVKVYAFGASLQKSILLGSAYKIDSKTWRYRWQSAKFQDGQYSIKAQVVVNDQTTVTNEITVTKVTQVASLPKVTASTSIETVTKPIVPVVVKASELKPEAVIDIQKSGVLLKTVPIVITVAHASSVELYVQGKNSLIKKFLGKALSVDMDRWMLDFDTTQVPNGDYTVIANILNQYGLYETKSSPVTIRNVVVESYSPAQQEQINVLTVIADDEQKEKEKQLAVEPQPAPTLEISNEVKLEEPQKEKIKDGLNHLSTALRVSDTNNIDTVKKRFEDIKQEIIDSHGEQENKEALSGKIDVYIKKEIERIEQEVQKTNDLIAERTKEVASKDSDNDGIANYDEVTLYKTNPFVADSDGDGFIDSAEVLSGYNPNNPASEALVAYESPKETGIVREDILEVSSIATALQNDEEESNATPSAILTGKAMPNSFVTLYIFSTPIVITLKTDADGSWSYRFDKELEDGEHEVYVGVTDNAGKIVAKSNPFAFVKEAQAFTPVEASNNPQVNPVVVEEQSFLSEYMVYLVLSISVVAIGLVLILLGLHLDSRQRKYVVTSKETEVTA